MTAIDTTDVSAYLLGKGVRTHRANGNEVTAHCFFCSDGNPKGKGKLYINIETWLYDCKRCSTRGNRKTLLRHYGDTDAVEAVERNPFTRREILEGATAHGEDCLESNVARLSEMFQRGLNAETIVEARLGFAPAGRAFSKSLKVDPERTFTFIELKSAGLLTEHGAEFYDGCFLIPYFSHGAVVSLRAKDPKGKYRTATGDDVRLYNADALSGAEIAIITEGEFDALILQQHLRASGDPYLASIAVVAIPGANALPNDFASYFVHCKRVFIALDPDETGQKATEEIKALLGTKTRVVRLPEELPKCDWTEYLRPKNAEHPHGGHSWTDVAELIAAAEAEGRRLWTIQDSAREWERVDKVVGGIKLGFDTFDALIKPGLKPGQLLVPLAKTGTGKTLWCCNVAFNLRERPVLYISLEMTRAEIYERLRRIYYFFNPLGTPADLNDQLSRLRIVDANRLREGSVTELCEEFNDDVGTPAEVVFVDYLGYFSRALRGRDNYERTGNAVMALKEEAKACGVGIISPHQVNRGVDVGKPITLDDARDSGAVEETADILVSLYRPGDAVTPVVGQRMVVDSSLRIQLLKNRNGMVGQGGMLKMSAASWVIVDATDLKGTKIDQENDLITKGESYETILRAQILHAQEQLVLAGV